MVVRGLVNGLFAIGSAAGLGLFAWALVVVGVMRHTPGSRPWGSLAALPRPAFVAYFGTLGLTWSFCFVLLMSERGNQYLVPMIAGPAIVCLTLIVGWMVAAQRARGSRQTRT